VGSNEAGITTTLGARRVVIYRALMAGRSRPIHRIWDDSTASLTSDPRVCPDALRVKVISFEAPRGWPTSAPKCCTRPPILPL